MNTRLVTRREFIRATCATGAVFLAKTEPAHPAEPLFETEARYYRTLANATVQCDLCPRQCMVEPGARGHCNVRANRDGKYYSLVYGRMAAMHNDPIEKKPFFHFLPGSTAISIATAGCNFNCKFCQNWDLSQRKPEEVEYTKCSPDQIVQAALQWNCRSIAYTYNEPIVQTEFIVDTASAGRKRGVRSVIISNGFIRKAPLTDLAKGIDGYKVDLKAFEEGFYNDVVGGKLQPVLDTLVNLKSMGVWTEIVYLLIPTLNDGTTVLKNMVRWIRHELGPDVPLHFSRFYPQYKLKNLPPTPMDTLEKAWNIGKEAGLNYVYVGNIPGHPGENTSCPNCKKTVISRIGFQLLKNQISGGKCLFCGNPIPGVWS